MTVPFKPPAMPESNVWVEILSTTNLESVCMVQYATVTATLFYNSVGSYSILAPYSDYLWSKVMVGDFVVRVNWRGLFSFGGKCEQPTYMNSIPGAGAGMGNLSGPFIMMSGADYLSIIANRIAYPDYTKAWSQQLPDSADVVINIPLETAIKHYVNYNVGPGALANRQHPLLDIAADQHRGPNVNYSVKFGSGVSLNLLDVVRALINQANINMGIRVTQNGNRLLFDVYLPIDKSGTATFSEELGNLTSISFSLTDPTCTDALVQGASKFVSAVSSTNTPWNKTEEFVDDSSETDVNNLNTTANNTLFSGAFGPNMSTTATDTPYTIYGRDYAIGDIVTVVVRPDTPLISAITYTDIVSSVALTCDPAQTPILNVVPVIGNDTSPNASDKSFTGQIVHRIVDIEKKLARRNK
jgi:hypothetical protein